MSSQRSDIITVIKSQLPIRWLKNTKMQQFKRWLSINAGFKHKLGKQLSFENEPKLGQQFKGMRVFVPLIETSHYQHFHVLIIAKALQLRGAEVKVLLCGEVLQGCEIKSVRNENSLDPCWNCRIHAGQLSPLFKLDVSRLSDYLSLSEIRSIQIEAKQVLSQKDKIEKHNVSLNSAVEDSLVRYFYGAVPGDQPTLERVSQAHAMTALLATEIAKRIDSQWNPDVVFNNMYCYSAWEPFYLYYRKNGNRFRSLSLTQFDFQSVQLNAFELYGSNERYLRYVGSRDQKNLTITERDVLNAFCKKRFGGQSQIFQRDGYFQDVEQQTLVEILALDTSKRNIFLFSNIYWDVGLSEMGSLYDDVIDWVLDSISLTKDMANCHLYIKPHPGEVLDSASSLKGIADIIAEKYPSLPSNISIINPEWKIRTYELFPYVDVGVIFSGTLGLEMMLSGVPVISTGKTTHMGLGFAAEPKTLNEYAAVLKGDQQTPKPDQKELELFAFFYFVRTLIPWNLTKQAYADNFDGFSIDSLEEIMPGMNPHLDHMCNCIMDSQNQVFEAWPTLG